MRIFWTLAPLWNLINLLSLQVVVMWDWEGTIQFGHVMIETNPVEEEDY
jgi:hypothetical protein